MITKNILNNLKFILFGLVLILGASYVHADWSAPTEAPTGGNTQPPINVSSTAQVKDGGLAVNAFLASASAEFDQEVLVKGNLKVNGSTSSIGAIQTDSLKSTKDNVQICSDSSGKLTPCTTGAATPATPSILYSVSNGGDLYTYTNKGTSICTNSNSGQAWSKVGEVSITNTTDSNKNYIIIASASVTNDGGADYPQLMLKEGNPNSYVHTDVLAFNQIVTDNTDFWEGNSARRAGLIQISYLYNISGGSTKNFNTWITENAGGCFQFLGGKIQIAQL